MSTFLQQLLDETLIAVSEAVEPRPQAPGQGTAGGKRRTYVTPAFDRYTDMAELLLIDPVHDVDEAGWPFRRTGLRPLVAVGASSALVT